MVFNAFYPVLKKRTMKNQANGVLLTSWEKEQTAKEVNVNELPTIRVNGCEMMRIIGKSVYQLTTIMYKAPVINQKFKIVAVTYPDGQPTGMICNRYVIRVEELPMPTQDENYYNIWLSPSQIDAE
jgi:hypothetical protein